MKETLNQLDQSSKSHEMVSAKLNETTESLRINQSLLQDVQSQLTVQIEESKKSRANEQVLLEASDNQLAKIDRLEHQVVKSDNKMQDQS